MKLGAKLVSLAEGARGYCSSARYAKINWHAHFLPIVKEAYKEFSIATRQEGLQSAFMTVLSEANAAEFNDATPICWSDSVSLTFGIRPVPCRPVLQLKKGLWVLSETQASLVFSQSVSGAVTALIYPPSSEVGKPIKPYYAVAMELDPSLYTKSDVLGLLTLAFEVDIFCGARVFPNHRGGRLIAKLIARDSVIEGGGSKIWAWISYIFKSVSLVLRLYGIGGPGVAK